MVVIYVADIEKTLRGYVVITGVYIMFLTAICVLIARIIDLYDKIKKRNKKNKNE